LKKRKEKKKNKEKHYHEGHEEGTKNTKKRQGKEIETEGPDKTDFRHSGESRDPAAFTN